MASPICSSVTIGGSESCSDDSGSENSPDVEEQEAEAPEQAPNLPKKKTRGRVKIGIKLIDQKQKRSATFHKRKSGLMKKGFELSVLTGAEVLVLAAWGDSVFSYSTKKLQRVLTSQSGQELIHHCLKTPAEDVADEEVAMRWNPEGYIVRELTIPKNEKRKRLQQTLQGEAPDTKSKREVKPLGSLSPPKQHSAPQTDGNHLMQGSFPGLEMSPVVLHGLNPGNPVMSMAGDQSPTAVNSQQPPPQQAHGPAHPTQPQLSQSQVHTPQQPPHVGTPQLTPGSKSGIDRQSSSSSLGIASASSDSHISTASTVMPMSDPISSTFLFQQTRPNQAQALAPLMSAPLPQISPFPPTQQYLSSDGNVGSLTALPRDDPSGSMSLILPQSHAFVTGQAASSSPQFVKSNLVNGLMYGAYQTQSANRFVYVQQQQQQQQQHQQQQQQQQHQQHQQSQQPQQPPQQQQHST